jgi:error-prone DNA polymerase
MAAVLEHKPGFYPLHTILEEARLLGVPVLPPDVHLSGVKYLVERNEAGRDCIRVPLTQIKRFSPETAAQLVLERALHPFTSLEDLMQRVTLAKDVWENLARSGALRAWGERREVLWQVRALAAVFAPPGHEEQGQLDFEMPWQLPDLTPLTQSEELTWDFQTQGLTTGPHPLALQRPDLERFGARAIGDLQKQASGSRVLVAGAVITRQRPPTAEGMCFVILEDETGRVQTAITPPVYEKFARVLRESGLLVEGKVEDGGEMSRNAYRSVSISRIWPLSAVCGPISNGATGHPEKSGD